MTEPTATFVTRAPTPRVAPLAHLAWRDATVASAVTETPDARSLVLEVPGWSGHVAGQHVDVRLTADDGYQATRSYSLSSGPGEAPMITVQEVEDGEVSSYLVRDIAVGDVLEVRGPIGGYFVWTGRPRPLLLIGGGSGLAPLRAMWRAADPTAPRRGARLGHHAGPPAVCRRARRPRRHRCGRHRAPLPVRRPPGCRAARAHPSRT